MTGVIPAAQLFDLTGEVALVTGASSGLGERFAEVLAAHGAKVVVWARRKDRLEALVGKIGAAAVAATLDVTSRESIASAFDAAEVRFGPVTLLVNNAGVANGETFLKTTPETHDSVQRTNVDGVWHMAQEFSRRLITAEKPGTIINIASMLGYRVENNSLTYAASKAAVLQLTHGMAVELARHNIRVNAIAPGYIMSEMTEGWLTSDGGKAMLKRIPQRRTGEPSDLDGALLLLASRKASGYMTGTTIVADGGHMWSFS